MTLSYLRTGAAALAGPVVALVVALCLGLGVVASPAAAQAPSSPIKRVLLISIDGMHAVDFQNCANGIGTVNNGEPYCPALAALAKTGVNYVAASTSKPSDSFPGLTAIVTGGSPAFTGVYYDVAYSRNLTLRQNHGQWRRLRPLHSLRRAHRHHHRIRRRHRYRPRPKSTAARPEQG